MQNSKLSLFSKIRGLHRICKTSSVPAKGLVKMERYPINTSNCISQHTTRGSKLLKPNGSFQSNKFVKKEIFDCVKC